MGKFLKILGIAVGVTLLLLIVAIVVLPMIFDPNDYKQEIVEKVEQQTGRKLTIDGDLKLSVFPWLGIDIGALELSNAKGFGDAPFAAVKSAAVRVKLMPLLSRELEVDTIGLDGLRLNLAKNKQGKSNWDDLAKGGGSAKPEEKGGEAGPGLASLTIGGVDISDASIVWDDRSSGQRFQIDRFNLKSGAIRQGRPVALEMGLDLASSEPKLNARVMLTGEVSVDGGTARVKDLQVKINAEGEALTAGKLEAELTTGLVLALNGDSLQLDNLKLVSGPLQLSGQIKGEKLASSPALSGTINLAEFNLRQWMESQGLAVPETADPQVLTRVALSASLSSQGSSTRLKPLKLTLDDSTLQGEASLKGKAIGFNLELDRIDADRYLPPKSQQPQSKAERPAGSGDEPLFPVDTLRQLNANGVVRIGELIINKLTARQIELTVKAANGRISSSQKVGQFYDGALDGKVSLDVTGKQPRLAASKSLQGLQAGPMLKDLTGKDTLTGKGRFSSSVTATGNSVNAIKRSLNGKLDFRFENGAVKGVNLAQLLRETKARFSGQPVPKSDAPAQTDFSELSGSGVITNGVLNNQDLLAQSPFLRVTGKGQVDLVQETLNYLVTTKIVASAKGQGGEGLEELNGVPIPVKLTGNYAAPDYSIDWGSILVASQKEKLKSKLQEKLKAKLGGATGGSGSATGGSTTDSGGGSLKEQLLKGILGR